MAPDKMRKVVLCSGQILPDVHARATRKVDDVLLVRIEQLAPFPFDRIAPVLALPPQLLDHFPCLLHLLVDPVPLQDGAAALQYLGRIPMPNPLDAKRDTIRVVGLAKCWGLPPSRCCLPSMLPPPPSVH